MVFLGAVVASGYNSIERGLGVFHLREEVSHALPARKVAGEFDRRHLVFISFAAITLARYWRYVVVRLQGLKTS